jgi:NTP pyrophosphatase (non-canonical NTP hydrolase)
MKKNKQKYESTHTIQACFDEARRLSKKAERIRPEKSTIENMILKLVEEVGELSCDILKLKQYKVNDEKKEDILTNAKEEVVDCFIILINISEKLDISDEDMVKIFRKKLKKWNKSHLNKNKQ